MPLLSLLPVLLSVLLLLGVADVGAGVAVVAAVAGAVADVGVGVVGCR